MTNNLLQSTIKPTVDVIVKLKNTKEMCSAFTGGKDGVDKKTDMVKLPSALPPVIRGLASTRELYLKHYDRLGEMRPIDSGEDA